MPGVSPVRGHRAFAALRTSSRRARTPLLTVTTSAVKPEVHSPVTASARVSFAIGKHVGCAVERNRVRRRLRSSLRSLSLQPADYLISVHRAGAQASYSSLDEALRGAMLRLDAVETPIEAAP